MNTLLETVTVNVRHGGFSPRRHFFAKLAIFRSTAAVTSPLRLAAKLTALPFEFTFFMFSDSLQAQSKDKKPKNQSLDCEKKSHH